MHYLIITLLGIAGILQIATMVKESGEVGTNTRNNIVECASKFHNKDTKMSYLQPLKNGISEKDARKLHDNCKEALSKEKLELEMNSNQSA